MGTFCFIAQTMAHDFLPGTAHQEPLHATPEAGKAGATAEWIAAGADAMQT